MQARSLLHPDIFLRRQVRVPPIFIAVLAQLLASGSVVLLVAALPRGPTILAVALLAQSTLAMSFSFLFRMRPWWLLFQALFVPGLFLASTAQIAGTWYLAAFGSLVLIYGSTYKTQVPLYLSRRRVWYALAEALPAKNNLRIADLGSGLGGLLAYLADLRRDSILCGIESAPLPVLFSKLRNAARRNVSQQWGDFWHRDLGEFDVVFAYLSPVAMPGLWQKAVVEMRPGTLFISYRFAVPDVVPSQEIVLQDLGQTRLYIWQM